MSSDHSNIVDIKKDDVNKKIVNFSDLLDSIESLDDKKKSLWREIYENAIIDRQNSFAMFKKLVDICEEKSVEHGVHARSMASYIERMSRANDQLIKLATLIAEEQKRANEIDAGDIYKQFNK